MQTGECGTKGAELTGAILDEGIDVGESAGASTVVPAGIAGDGLKRGVRIGYETVTELKAAKEGEGSVAGCCNEASKPGDGGSGRFAAPGSSSQLGGVCAENRAAPAGGGRGDAVALADAASCSLLLSSPGTVVAAL